MRSKAKTVLLLVVGAALLFLAGAGFRWFRRASYRSEVCKQRGMEFDERVERIRREAHDKLKIGTQKNDVIQFFSENNIPLRFVRSSATGEIRTSGCAPFGCGLDTALIGVRVQLDEAGDVKSEPVVVGMYTDCL